MSPESPIGGTIAPVTRNRDRDHTWVGVEPITILPEVSTTGCLESKRICPNCGVQRVTIHQPDGKHYSTWRLPTGDSWPHQGRPPCVGEVKRSRTPVTDDRESRDRPSHEPNLESQ